MLEYIEFNLWSIIECIIKSIAGSILSTDTNAVMRREVIQPSEFHLQSNGIARLDENPNRPRSDADSQHDWEININLLLEISVCTYSRDKLRPGDRPVTKSIDRFKDSYLRMIIVFDMAHDQDLCPGCDQKNQEHTTKQYRLHQSIYFEGSIPEKNAHLLIVKMFKI